MHNESSKEKSKAISLSELSFADIARIRREKDQTKNVIQSEKQKTEVVEEKPAQELYESHPVEFRDNISIETDFHKVPNNLHKIAILQDPKEYCVYTYLYRLSYGWHRNFCRVGYGAIVKNTSLSSRSSAIRAVESLLKKIHIIRIDEDSQKRAGTLYRVLTPDEVLSSVFKMSIVNLNIVKLSISKETISKMTILILNIPYVQNEYSQNEYTEESIDTQGLATVSKMNIVNLTPNKDNIKDSIKNTLSKEEIISLFYKGIGHSRITKEKRERAKECIEELIIDNFGLEDIQFAIEWTLKNKTEKLYDFSIIKHTIGEAMAAKEKADALQKQRFDEENKALLEREEYERTQKENQRLNSYKESMNADDRASLRERALAEIRKMPEIKEDFISDMLINSKENEILKKEIGTVVKDSEDKNSIQAISKPE